MRDVQLQSGRAISERLSFDPPKKELFCGSCALDVAASLDNLRGVRVEIFPVVMLCGAFRCERCNLRTGLLHEVREV